MKKLLNYFTQPFSVAEPFTGKKGAYVPVEELLDDVEGIIEGKYDKLKKEDFYLIGRPPAV